MSPEVASRLNECFMWYDYFGVPQEVGSANMLSAVDSIPAYISKSTYLMVLAPTLPHNDADGKVVSKVSWQDRGWCRLENTLFALLQKKSVGEMCSLYIFHTGFIVESVPMQWLYSLPSKGTFTVESDRAVVERITVSVANERLDRLAHMGSIFEYRFFRAVIRYIDSSREVEGDLDKWMQLYRFGSIWDVGAGDGWGPMHFAAVEGNKVILKKMADKGANVNEQSFGAASSILAGKGLTPLMAAANYIPDADTNFEVCKVLLQARASTDVKNAIGQTLLHVAAASPSSTGILKHLLEAKADVHQCDDTGATPLLVASLTDATNNVNKLANLELLMQYGAKWDAYGGPLDAMPWTFVGTSGPEVAQLFLGCKADPNVQLRPSAARDGVKEALGKQEGTSIAATLAVHGTGLTTLMVATWLGNWETVQVLLEARADPHLQTATGRRAMDWLTLYGVDGGHTYRLLEAAMASHAGA